MSTTRTVVIIHILNVSVHLLWYIIFEFIFICFDWILNSRNAVSLLCLSTIIKEQNILFIRFTPSTPLPPNCFLWLEPPTFMGLNVAKISEYPNIFVASPAEESGPLVTYGSHCGNFKLTGLHLLHAYYISQVVAFYINFKQQSWNCWLSNYSSYELNDIFCVCSVNIIKHKIRKFSTKVQLQKWICLLT